MTITEFLLARIAEDEAHATRVPTDWLYPEDYPALEMTEIGPGHTLIVSPTRVLAECQAKRAIIARHSEVSDDGSPDPVPWDVTCSGGDYDIIRYPETCPELRFLAAVYADHPDYREEWKP